MIVAGVTLTRQLRQAKPIWLTGHGHTGKRTRGKFPLSAKNCSWGICGYLGGEFRIRGRGI